ncbi:hypothetical protein AFM12_17305 [Jiulongibacter sediminis]|uniref:Transporter n=2 Tax=Jiulongibacter sediminis TaxID=1605367 RepID=A0A0P7B9F3_9BACT|nr:hypothetical protein AFM12_17305 [Jiulongibacter sediminis]TBX22329.1 hypothetical protein TK44_17310 [Jiulongibacter sediminis]
MIKMKKLILFLSLSGFSISVSSQEILTLDLAISEAVERNFSVKVAEKRVEAAENQIYKGNAGMSPQLDWITNINGSVNQVNQVFVDDRKINRLGQGFSPNTNLNLSWTLYDGRRMQVIYNRLQTQGQESLLQKKLVVQNVISNVMQVYYEILRQKKSVEYLGQIIKYYEERLNITEERWQIGRGSKLDYLQSKTDLTTQQVELVSAENQLRTSKVRLNNLLGTPADRSFEAEYISDEAPIYNLNTLLDQARSSNRDLLLLNKGIELSLLAEQEAFSFKKPRIALNSGFGYSFNRNNAGFLALNQSVGLTAGVSAVWNIFNGHQTQRDIQFARINTEVIQTQKQELLNQLEADLTASYYQFEADRELLNLEQANKEVAEENLNISLEKFRLGASTILELNEAQRRYDLSLNRLVNAQYNLRISELELLRMSGTLVE